MATSTIRAEKTYTSVYCYSPIIPTGNSNEICGFAIAKNLKNGVWKCTMAYDLKGGNQTWAFGDEFTVSDNQCGQRLTMTNGDAYYFVNTLRGGLMHARLTLTWLRNA